jgi:hypothetical protein
MSLGRNPNLLVIASFILAKKPQSIEKLGAEYRNYGYFIKNLLREMIKGHIFIFDKSRETIIISYYCKISEDRV